MRIVYMGTPEFAVPALKMLIEAKYDIVLVVTQPDRKGNRGRLIYSPIKKIANENDIEVAQPERIRGNEKFIEYLNKLNPDMIVVAAFGQILPQAVLNIPKYGCINIHGSLLPNLRGAAPMQYAILEGLQETGVTIMRMDAGLDTGDVISSESIKVAGKNINELSKELAELGAQLLLRTIPEIESGKAIYVKQDESIATNSALITKGDGATDFGGSADEELRKLRAYMDWPSLYSKVGDVTMKFFDAEISGMNDRNAPPGTVIKVDKDYFTINCGEGSLIVKEVQPQGKRRMKTSDFLRGHSIKEGDRFIKGK